MATKTDIKTRDDMLLEMDALLKQRARYVELNDFENALRVTKEYDELKAKREATR